MKISFSLFALLATGLLFTTSCSIDDEVECAQVSWYEDSDGDSFGDPDSEQLACTAPSGYVADNTDFDDDNDTAFPGASEICDDFIDNDGNGLIDECLVSQLIGSWTTNFGTSYEISNSLIHETSNNSRFHILRQEDNFLICQNDAGNPFYANAFSKFVFTNITSTEFRYCQSYFDSPSQMDIEDGMDLADESNLNTGCSGFAWGIATKN